MAYGLKASSCDPLRKTPIWYSSRNAIVRKNPPCTACSDPDKLCSDGVTCVFEEEFCDGKVTCPDGDDEVNCPGKTLYILLTSIV